MNRGEGEKKILFLLTYNFPWGDDHEFLVDEINYLATTFTEIHIVPLRSQAKQTHKIPANVVVTGFPSEKNLWKKLRLLFLADWPDVLEEFKNISSRYHLRRNTKLFKTAVSSYLRALDISHFLSKKLKKINSQKIFVYAFWNDTSALSVAIIKKHYPQVTAFSRAHRFDVYADRNELNYLPFTFLKFRFLDAVFFVSEDGRNYSLRQFPFIDISKTKMNRLGVELIPTINIKKSKKKLIILSIGFFLEVKRISLIAESLALIDDTEIEWFHIGEGFGDVASYREQVKHILKSSKNVTYNLLGNMNKSEVISFFQNQYIDLLVSVSSSEGIPVSMMEAMSAGIPVMGTDVGGVAEIVKDGYNGILLPPNPNAAFIANSLKEFYSMPEDQKEKFREHAFITWQKKFNAAINYPAFMKQVLNL